tara:strand:- start:1381 stop:2073 length:693 start_codon:yes stop_codon:yes gene_type:complete
MVNVDTVYQRVLAIANKEQRGYVTPQEFNLIANQAQGEIFEDYFTQSIAAKQAARNKSEYSDIVKILNEKMSFFKTRASLVYSNPFFLYPDDMYKLGTLWRTNNNLLENGVEIEEITENELLDYYQSPLTRPNHSRPLYIRSEENIRVISTPVIATGVIATYIRRPNGMGEEVEWGYVVTSGQAMYNATASNHFEIDQSEETLLVVKILELAGIIIQKPDLVGIGQQKQQ